MKKKTLLYLLFIPFIFSCSTDTDDNLEKKLLNKTSEIELSPLDKIPQDSELFEQLQQIATNEEAPNKNITCINFNYGLTIFVFNEFDQFSSINSVSDDNDFSELLASIPSQYSISISFPISATLEDGQEFSITTKEELRTSIDNCLDIERVGECNAFLQDCKFMVGYSLNYDNDYLGAFFDESNGLTHFTFEDQSAIGSWTALTIESELHINIFLVDASEELTEFFNYDWIVEYLDDNSLKLTNEDRELILNQKCDFDEPDCTSFKFESCENTPNTGIADFIFSDYTDCIRKILEISDESTLTFHSSFNDADANSNLLPIDNVYNNTETEESIFVKVTDFDNDLEYIVEILLVAVNC